MSNVENEIGLHGVDLENGLHDRRNGDLGDCRLSCPKRHCRAKIGEHDRESQMQVVSWWPVVSRESSGGGSEGSGASAGGSGRAGRA